MALTERQIEYLLIFSGRDGEKKSISEAAELLGVSKPTAFSVTEALVARKMIVKGEQGEVRLTDEGWAFLGEKPKYLQQLIEWMTMGLGLAPAHAENEARRMLAVLEPDTVMSIIGDWQCPVKEKNDQFMDELAPGVYSLPFRIHKRDRNELSMGDKGFEKPARLIKSKNRSFIYLRPKEFRYKVGSRKSVAGSLDRLWYRMDNSWFEVKENGDGSFALPGAAVFYRECKGERSGVLRIRARASVGILGMPESEADVILSLEQINLIDVPDSSPLSDEIEEELIK